MTHLQKTVIIGLLLFSALLLASLFYLFIEPENGFNKNSSPPPPAITSDKPKGGNFTLTAQDGQHSLSDFKGKLVVLYFGYTYCPDICPTDLGNLSMAYQRLTDTEKAQLQILFVTVDPKRDTTERMAEYTQYFNANMIGLTGSEQDIATVTQQYGAVYFKPQQKNRENYTVDHSAFIYIIDQNGVLQTQLPHGSSVEKIQQTIQTYLK